MKKEKTDIMIKLSILRAQLKLMNKKTPTWSPESLTELIDWGYYRDIGKRYTK
jgi:hypothetical protein